MSNTITIELCAEDRARQDRLYAAVTRLVDLLTLHTNNAELDDLREKLAATLKNADPAQAPKNAPGAAQATTPADTQPRQEAAAAAEPTHPAEADLPWIDPPAAKQEAPAKEVTKKDLSNLIITLSAAGKKDKVREAVQSCCPGVTKVGDIPADKYAAVYEKLTALEG